MDHLSMLLDLDLDGHNSTSNTTLGALPSLLLNQFFPGFGLLSQLLLRHVGVDVTVILPILLGLWALLYGGRTVYTHVYDYVLVYFVSTMHIEKDDNLYDSTMDWVSSHHMTATSRDIIAETDPRGYDSDEEDEDIISDGTGIFNYSKWSRTFPPRYEPYYGNSTFRHDGRWFMLTHTRSDPIPGRYGGILREENLTIRCLGRSTQPLKNLLCHIKVWDSEKAIRLTAVWRPAPKDSEERCWERTVSRMARPISTVSLDVDQKVKIVRDINEYLQPVTARWYAARGIPHRRGYLFHGPPGTGKTSLSFALAGIFGLNVFCVSLNERGLTESCLNQLFKELPRRCIVLLEDIDSAGLRREELDPDSGPGPDGSDDSDGLHSRIAASKGSSSSSSISLSGLLNVIDGAAAHEGRVLIMTTNCPESLDAALIRPGRVDLQVEFTLATHDQIRDMFVRMYNPEHDFQQHIRDKGAAPGIFDAQQTTAEVKDGKKKKNADEEFLKLVTAALPKVDTFSPENIAEMAEHFAEQLPENTFSPAEVQGYLLKKKRDPVQALEEICKWRDGVLEAKKKGTKVVSEK
ncbi:hypothetical protein CFE70_006477 [Pyrenophora teres f. teres 0-1]|uniref:Mitochondrial chaperone bcs1 n=2 Tax=Pyrenophora teres f. teres TaxID=97479 RepID=E3S872_PYRTT|nr:hypothetical protein PTT_19104 [Pyrenophora teres f. teres 0-1]KAE8828100.1 hypothetical protein HRS9139_07319 [Pyrenophora teres f. teres]KAE8829479.1 hypothetical protein HRS9122_09294 [Pyrenophora teres f. teres]KAE8830697.1 hypothetical protein PTNB85_07284 [Pyrenophora teres f. teres]KAE8857302.1 hypothetical protein PTNB29_08369 [Pyrenophora teres f. teres]